MLIKTYKGKNIDQPHFFILNKGNNCGKPLTAACRSCFVCLVNTDEEKEFYYWLCYALWQTAQFEPYLAGSVIPFIHIRDVKSIVANASVKVRQKPVEYQKKLTALIEIDQQHKALSKQLNLLAELKKVLLRNIL